MSIRGNLKIIYNVNVLSLLKYDPSQTIANFSFGGYTNSPYVDLEGGLFTIPYNYSSNFITIDSSNEEWLSVDGWGIYASDIKTQEE